MIGNEGVLTFSEAAAALPRLNGRRVHTSTLWRWATKGVRGVRLECRRLGGRYVTSLAAVDRFASALAEAGPPTPSHVRESRQRQRTAKQREHDQAAAEATLRRAHI